MLADGETRRLKLLFKSKLEWKENNLRASIWRKNFSNIVTYKFGKTQNEFVAEEVFKNKSNNHHNIWVFDKEK
jgi:PKD repeat protein